MKTKKPVAKKPTRVSNSRREIAKKAAYAVPAILTLAVAPSFAAAASAPADRYGSRPRN